MSKAVANVEGRCPMGCGETLFVGKGGHLTCSYFACPDPSAIDRLVHSAASEEIEIGGMPSSDDTADLQIQALTEACACEHGRWAHADRKGRCFAEGCPCQSFAPTGKVLVVPEAVQLANRFIEGAQILERAGEDKDEKAMCRARQLADGMRLQAITVALGLEEPDA